MTAVAPDLTIDPFDDAFLTDPYAYHDELREAGPVVFLSRYGIYAMARHADVSAALRDWEAFPRRADTLPRTGPHAYPNQQFE